MKTLFVLLISLAGALEAQTGGSPAPCVTRNNCYVAYKETALAGAAEKITLQTGTASTSLNVHPLQGTVYCSAAADITLTQNGSAATTTTFAIVGVNSNPFSATSAAFSASNVGAGTTIDKISIPSGGGTFTWDLSTLVLYGNSSGGQNISIGTSSVTATCRIRILYYEANT